MDKRIENIYRRANSQYPINKNNVKKIRPDWLRIAS
jgi:hypothetical protein